MPDKYLDIALADGKTAIDLRPESEKQDEDYLDAVHMFDEDSVHAVNAALASQRPLLVRGEPGVGKSQLARAAAKQLERVFLHYSVDIETEAKDLLWHFDSIQRLADSQLAGAYTPHGVEISEKALEQHRTKLKKDLDIAKFLHPGPLWWAFNWRSAEQQARDAKSKVPDLNGADSANGCVILIDEIDKAETDVPNGLLEALGARQFTPFGSPKAVNALPPYPLVIITTNEERALPDAFLRRCLVLDLEFPSKQEDLIVRGQKHFPKVARNIHELAVKQLYEDRENAEKQGLRPLPGQAEYLDLIRVLHEMRPEDEVAQKALLKKIRKFALRKHKSKT